VTTNPPVPGDPDRGNEPSSKSLAEINRSKGQCELDIESVRVEFIMRFRLSRKTRRRASTLAFIVFGLVTAVAMYARLA